MTTEDVTLAVSQESQQSVVKTRAAHEFLIGICWPNPKAILRRLDYQSWSECTISLRRLDDRPIILFECCDPLNSCVCSYVWEETAHWNFGPACQNDWSLTILWSDLVQMLTRADTRSLEWVLCDLMKHSLLLKSHQSDGTSATEDDSWTCSCYVRQQQATPKTALDSRNMEQWSIKIENAHPMLFQNLISHLATTDSYFHVGAVRTTAGTNKSSDDHTRDVGWLLIQSLAPRSELQYAIPCIPVTQFSTTKDQAKTNGTATDQTKTTAAEVVDRRSPSVSVRQTQLAAATRINGNRRSVALLEREAKWIQKAQLDKTLKQEGSSSWRMTLTCKLPMYKILQPAFQLGSTLFERFRPECSEWTSPDTWIRHEFAYQDIDYMIEQCLTPQLAIQRLLAERLPTVTLGSTKIAPSGLELEYTGKITAYGQLTAFYRQRFPGFRDRAAVTNTLWHQTESFCKVRHPRLPVHNLLSVQFQELYRIYKQRALKRTVNKQLMSDYADAQILLAASASGVSGLEYYSGLFEWRNILIVPREINSRQNLIMVQRIIPILPSTTASIDARSALQRTQLLKRYPSIIAFTIGNNNTDTNLTNAIWQLGVLTEEAFFFASGITPASTSSKPEPRLQTRTNKRRKS